MEGIYWIFLSLALTISGGFFAGQKYTFNSEPIVSTEIEKIFESATSLEILGKSPEAKMMNYFSSRPCTRTGDQPFAEKWLKRMIIQIGVQKGGTKAMHTYLEENLQFVSRCSKEFATVELNYFNYNATVEADFEGPIDQRALQSMYAGRIYEACPMAVETLVQEPAKMYLDDSPLYMQDSDSIPQLLNCVVPWAKILAILRNPTDRAFSHYNFYLERNWCTDLTFDEWIDENIQDLADAGVMDAKDEYEELLAWRHYNDLHRHDRKCRTFVTRGLYAIQLLHYTTALKSAGRPPSDLVVISSDHLKGPKRQQTYDRVLNSLGLEAHQLDQSAPVHKTAYKRTMKKETRAKLDAFFKPYNSRLFKMFELQEVWV